MVKEVIDGTDVQAEPSAVANFFAAAAAAAMTKTVVYPMETRTLLLAIAKPGASTDFSVAQLFHGLRFSLFDTAVYNGLLFLLKEKVKASHGFSSAGQKLSFAEATCATLLAKIIDHPNMNILAGIQGSLRSPSGAQGAWQVTQSILSTAGVRGFWTGFSITAFMNFRDAIDVYTYEIIRLFLSRFLPEDAKNFTAGGLSRVVALFLFQPFKTLQVRSQVAAAGGDMVAWSWSWPFFQGLYAGVGTILFSSAVKVSFRLMITERLRHFFQRLFDRRHSSEKNKKLTSN